MKELKNNIILFIDAFLIGIIGAITTEIFLVLLDFVSKFALGYIAGYLPPDMVNFIEIHIKHSYNPFLSLIVLVIGGLITGLIVYTFAPEAEGHGIDTIIRAIHRTGGYIRPIVIPVKILASAITIGTGGAAGKGGPAALFSAGIGSLYTNIKQASLKRREMFVMLGMASGLSVIFNAPLGVAIFTFEVLFLNSEFSIKELMFVLFGSLIAYTLAGFLFGWHPIFHVHFDKINFLNIKIIIFIILFGIISGLASIFVPNVFYYIRDFFRKLPIKPHFKPALGAFLTGIIAIWYPQVLGAGYGWVQKAINGDLAFNLMLALFFLKLIAFSFTVGSGHSGGVFAPTVFIGAILGGAYAYLFHQDITVFTLLGMGSLFSAASRTPLAGVVLILEMTGGYMLLVPLILSVFFAYFIHLIITDIYNIKYITLYEAQLINRNYAPIFQIEKLKDILLSYIDLLNLSPRQIKDQHLLELLESGKPIKLPSGEYLYFGQIIKDMKLKEFDNAKYIENARVLYVFRKGEWLHPKEIKEIYKGDEVLILGKKEDIENLEKIFVPVSEIFSKLRIQEEAIKGSTYQVK